MKWTFRTQTDIWHKLWSAPKPLAGYLVFVSIRVAILDIVNMLYVHWFFPRNKHLHSKPNWLENVKSIQYTWSYCWICTLVGRPWGCRCVHNWRNTRWQTKNERTLFQASVVHFVQANLGKYDGKRYIEWTPRHIYNGELTRAMYTVWSLWLNWDDQPDI